MVSCRKFRRVSILWMLWLVDFEGCWIGVVLPPFGQKGLRPFLASYRQYTYSRAYSILDSIRRHFFKCFGSVALKIVFLTSVLN